jgi:hypothetical protein
MLRFCACRQSRTRVAQTVDGLSELRSIHCQLRHNLSQTG